MKTLTIPETEETPKVILDVDKGKFEIAGKSYMEDSVLFYKPVIEWLGGYSQNPNPETQFEFKMEYVNTASSKIILDILELLGEIDILEGKRVLIKWYFFEDDEDIEEAGKEYAELNALSFDFIPMAY